MSKLKQLDNTLKLVTVNQACERYQFSRNTLMRVADDLGAIKRFGRTVRIDVQAMDKAIEANC